MCVVLDVEYGNSTYKLPSNLCYYNLNCQLSEKEVCLVKVGNNDRCSLQSPLLWKGQKLSFQEKTRFLYDSFDCRISKLFVKTSVCQFAV